MDVWTCLNVSMAETENEYDSKLTFQKFASLISIDSDVVITFLSSHRKFVFYFLLSAFATYNASLFPSPDLYKRDLPWKLSSKYLIRQNKWLLATPYQETCHWENVQVLTGQVTFVATNHMRGRYCHKK